MSTSLSPQAQGEIWSFYRPRHAHAWNILVLSWRALEHFQDEEDIGFEVEYLWENFILRLWLYRSTIKTLTKLPAAKQGAQEILATFDQGFTVDGRNGLKAIRDMLEHFDDYAAGTGRGPAIRDGDLDPWRSVTRDRYERGQFILDRGASYDAAITLRSGATEVGEVFLSWYRTHTS